MASAYLSRTPSSNGNQKKFTFSAWIKITKLGGQRTIFCGYYGNQNRYTQFWQGTDDKIVFFSGDYSTSSTTQAVNLKTTRTLRDTSAWYHLVLVVDTTLATQADRAKLYINGELETWDTGYGSHLLPDLNDEYFINVNTTPLHIGTYDTTSTYFDGLMTHIHLTDGYAYAASDFGETDSTSGIWKPKTSPSVTYGTNGFFLKMENSSDMGEDSSGNNNDFTTSGTITQTEDTPSNNFATLNAVYKAAYQPTFSTGNLTATAPNSGEYYPAFSSLGVESGKWYMEYKIGAAGTFHIGICSENDANTVFPTTDNYMGESSKSVGISDGNGSYYISASATSYGSSYTSGDIIGLALDMTNKKLYVSKNGTFFNSANPASGTGGIDISGILSSGDIAFFAHSCYGGTGTRAIEANFGNGRFGTTALASSNSDGDGLGLFEYSVPSGYYALCTKNIKNYG